MQKSDLRKTMKEKAESIQAVVEGVKTFDDVFRYAIDLTKKQGGKSIAAPLWDEKKLSSLQKFCDTSDLQLLTPPLRAHLTDIHTALTPAQWGIAETGTLVLNSRSEDLRIATMLSETHVAVLKESRIRADAMTLKDALDEQMKASPSYLAFITGPSRTADIERVLTIGVHGPQELHILIMEDNNA
jgi:L-lactate dehydrogenase complex protein LldG